MELFTMHPSLTVDKLARAVRRSMSDDSYPGFCTACGKRHTNVEPDAERYPCSSHACKGSPTVYGAEQLLLLVQA